MPILSMLLTDPVAVATLIALAIVVSYVFILIFLFRVQAEQGGLSVWLFVAVGASLLSILPHAFLTPTAHEFYTFPGNLTQPALGVYLSALVMLAFSRLSMRFLRHKIPVGLTVLGLLWLLCLPLTGASTVPLTLGMPGWQRDAIQIPNLPALLCLGGWIILFVYHLGITLRAYRHAHLPELANRMLFWVVIVPLFFLGMAMGTSGVRPWYEIGWGVQLMSMVGAAYSMALHRIFDIRRSAQRAIRFWMIALVIMPVMLVLLLLALVWPFDSFLGLMILALGAAIITAPIIKLTELLANRLLGTVLMDPAQVLRRYSQEIVVQIDLHQLAVHLIDTLTTMLKVKRGALILTEEKDDVILLKLLNSSEATETSGVLHYDSPIYQTLSKDRSVLLQYDLEYQNRFAGISQEERAFFAEQQMNVYAPIIVGDELIGIIASGSKVDDTPFYAQELSLLVTIANQTGISLRNARLVDDLRTREAEMIALNESINEANAQLARLDTVKSDFITIASHELRTPLAQIRGYTDIMQAFSEQGFLEETMVNDITAKLRKATGRLEVLISDMLDVSQLDVDAMDLRFVEARPVSVMRMAIDPLTDALKERNLTLAARGLSDLPPIKADLERLVQAFRNVIVNAIKYTPDGGSIEIIGEIHATDDADEATEVRISITDTGVGVASEHIELIFEKFFRGADPSLHSTGATKFMGAGPGLGLTIARGVIEGHGGSIYCESAGFDLENFPGTTFYVILPVTPPEDASHVLPFETTGAATPAPIS